MDEAKLPRSSRPVALLPHRSRRSGARHARLYRVHQFTKVEMFAFCTPEQSDAIHEEIRELEEGIFQG